MLRPAEWGLAETGVRKRVCSVEAGWTALSALGESAAFCMQISADPFLDMERTGSVSARLIVKMDRVKFVTRA
jgi:hypothetical protein